MTTPKIRVWDIENTEDIGVFWKPGKQYVGHKQILQERVILCAAWKDVGSPYTYYTPTCKFEPVRGILPPYADDREVVEVLAAGLSDADVLVAHNGDRHDLGILNSRLLHYGLDPLPPILQIDTLKVARKHFNLNSNSLDYLAKFLGVGSKTKTDYDLWRRCLYGEKVALREMQDYNIDDVTLLEKVYLKLRPFMTNHPNLGTLQGTLDTCPNCGATGTLIKNGTRLAGRVSTKQRYHCTNCGAFPSGPPVRVKSNKGENIDVR